MNTYKRLILQCIAPLPACPGRGWADAARSAVPGAGGAATDTLNVILALLLVVGLIIALAWLVRRSGLAPMGIGGGGRVLASLSLGGRERAVLIEIGGQQMLLGVAAGQVTLLARFDQPVVTTPPAPGEFAARLKQWLEAGKRQ